MICHNENRLSTVLSAYYSSFLSDTPWTIPLLRAVNKFVCVDYVRCLHRYISVGRENNVLKAGPFLLIPGIGFILLSFYSPTT